MSQPGVGFFNKDLAQQYDEKNRSLRPISENLHFLMSLLLKDLPPRAQVLSVGAGTGAEILYLAKLFPQWNFVALEPSSAMIEICKNRITEAGFADRCEFVEGYIQDLPGETRFDAVLSILVGHFVTRNERLTFYQEMIHRMRDGAQFINAEISFDLDSPEFPSMLKAWEQIQSLMGATPESLAALPQALKEKLTVLPPKETERLIRQSGITNPAPFFQSFMICGWFGQKAKAK